MKDEAQVQWNHMISESQQLVALDQQGADTSKIESMLDFFASRVAEKISAPNIQVASMTFGELFSLYFERHAKVRSRCPEQTSYFFKAYAKARWQTVPVNQIVRRDIQEWVDSLATSSPSAATRALNVMSAVINWGIRRDLLPPMTNPCIGVERFHTPSRKRFIAPEEFARLAAAVELESDLFQDYFWLCLLTAAREGNVLSMSWDEIDFDLGTWTIPGEKFKTGETHVLPLNTWALHILKLRKSESSSKWVLPSPRRPGAHLAGTMKAWKRVLTLANVENLHIHDLRRTHASYMAIGGENQYVIAQMLGHKDPRSTAIYARLSVEPVRVATENFATKVQTMSQAIIRLERSPSREANTLSESSVKKTKARALTEDELPRFITAVLSLTHQTSADCFLSLLWTRQRKGLVTGMRWAQLDLENALWQIPQTASSPASTLALEPEVVTILRRRQASLDRHYVWVFPKRDGSGPVWCLDTAWYAILHRSGIDHFRIDDLRNTDLSAIRACITDLPVDI